MTSFVLKVIAMITMFCDHLGDSMLKGYSNFNLIGRIAFPIFAFQISEGYQKTSNLKKYFLRLFIFAIISQIPYMLVLSLFSDNIYKFNIFFTLFFGLLTIFVYDKINNFKINKFIKFFYGFTFMLFIGYIAQLLRFDYGFWGIIVIFSFYLFRNSKLISTICFLILCVIKYIVQIIINGYDYRYILMCICTMLPIVFINMYNKKQGYKIKYFLYLFYPVHLLFLYFIFR